MNSTWTANTQTVVNYYYFKIAEILLMIMKSAVFCL